MNFLSKELIYQMSSQKLTGLLYEKAMTEIELAIDAIHDQQWIDANIHLQKVNDVIERLGAGLNYEAGVIAHQLDTLYNYMANEVIKGNVNKDVTILKDVHTILQQLAAAWNEASQAGGTDAERNLLKKTSAYEQNIQILQE